MALQKDKTAYSQKAQECERERTVDLWDCKGFKIISWVQEAYEDMVRDGAEEVVGTSS